MCAGVKSELGRAEHPSASPPQAPPPPPALPWCNFTPHTTCSSHISSDTASQPSTYFSPGIQRWTCHRDDKAAFCLISAMCCWTCARDGEMVTTAKYVGLLQYIYTIYLSSIVYSRSGLHLTLSYYKYIRHQNIIEEIGRHYLALSLKY